ncbi:MAG: zf-HC2 domain-containing protein [Acidobacteriota bacterium]
MTHQEAVATLAAERYLLDEMPDARREAFEAHFFACEDCADEMRAAAALLEGAKDQRALFQTRATALPMADLRQSRRVSWSRTPALPWALAATLAGLVTYQSLWVVPSLRRSPPVALAPVTLRPENRGQETIVPLKKGADAVSLAIEVNDAPAAGEVTYELATADGQRIVSGRAATPPAGTPLLVLMPSWTLTGSMHYILSVHDTASPGRTLGEYRFAVSTQ